MPFEFVTDVSAKGIRMRVAEQPSVGRDGPPSESLTFLALHDFLSNMESFTRVAEALAPIGRVVAMDFPGFGASEKPSAEKFPYGYRAFADAVLDVTAALGLSRVVLIGHGLGGAVALTLAAEHPSVARGLVLVHPHVYRTHWPVEARLATVPVLGRMVFKQLYRESSFRAMYPGSVLDAGLPSDDVSAPSASANNDRHAHPSGNHAARAFAIFGSPAARESAHATLVAMQDTRPLRALLPRVRTPSLLLWGRDVAHAPVHHARKLAHELSGSLLEVTQCGNAVHEEDPEAFVRAVRFFLRERNLRRRNSQA
jgi:pimeloyl-ACP methyl ester carboxylesterase